MSWFIRDQVIT